MAEVEILVKPPSRRAAREALRRIVEEEPQAVLLNLPESIEDLVAELASGIMDYERFFEEVGGRLPEPPAAWLKGYEEILKSLSKIRRRFDVYCYGDPAAFRVSAEHSLQLALLTLRSMITGRVDVREWLRVLGEGARLWEAASEREAEKAASISTNYDKSICISDYAPAHLRNRLKLEGVKLRVRYLGQPYHFTPIEILRRKLAKGAVDEKEAEELVREHIRFVREYLYRKPLPEAVENWSSRKLYWIRGERGS